MEVPGSSSKLFTCVWLNTYNGLGTSSPSSENSLDDCGSLTSSPSFFTTTELSKTYTAVPSPTKAGVFYYADINTGSAIRGNVSALTTVYIQNRQKNRLMELCREMLQDVT